MRVLTRAARATLLSLPPPALRAPQLCLPCPSWVSREYAPLFPADAPDTSTKEGKVALLGRFRKQLTPVAKWLLQHNLRTEDDQVRRVAPPLAAARRCAVCAASSAA